MASRINKLGVASLTALVAIAAFIVFSPKNESSGHNASTPPARPETTQPTEVEEPVNFTLPLYTKSAALVCPLSVASDPREGHGLKDAMDAHLSIFGHEDAVEKLGCQEWREGLLVSLTAEGQKQATAWEEGKNCGMVEFTEGYIFSCDLKNSTADTADLKNATAAPDAPSPVVPWVRPSAANASASDITLDLNVIGNDQKPILNLKTNLPHKSILKALLVNPINQGGDGYVGEAEGAVGADQVVQFGPFSKTGDSLSPGIYLLTVTTVGADLQPKEVQAFFGAHGEGLTGRQVLTLPGTSERLVSQKFQFKINPDGSIDNLPASSGKD